MRWFAHRTRFSDGTLYVVVPEEGDTQKAFLIRQDGSVRWNVGMTLRDAVYYDVTLHMWKEVEPDPRYAHLVDNAAWFVVEHANEGA